jgi:hypothetical protein
MDKETLRMQMLSGIITESEYKAKLNEAEEAQAIATAEKIEADVEKAPSVKDALNKLSDEEKDQLRAKLTKAGITANSRIKDVAGKLDEPLTEAEGDTKTKVANALSAVGGGLMKSMIVPLIPLIVGKITGTGFIGGTAITAGAAGALIGLAKLLDAGEAKNSLNEHYVAGGIVGIGAINQIPSRVKADYEDAFEYFLSQKYNLNEAEGDTMVDSTTLASYIDELISLADDMEYTPDMTKGLQDLKARLSGGEMSVENALDIIKQTIEITGDDIDAVEALGQAVDYDDAIVAKAREIAGLEEGKEKSLYEAEVNENVGSTIEKILQSFEFSEKGNDEMIEFANYLLSPEGPKNIAMSIKSRLKGEGGENYFTSTPDELNALLSKLR